MELILAAENIQIVAFVISTLGLLQIVIVYYTDAQKNKSYDPCHSLSCENVELVHGKPQIILFELTVIIFQTDHLDIYYLL